MKEKNLDLNCQGKLWKRQWILELLINEKIDKIQEKKNIFEFEIDLIIKKNYLNQDLKTKKVK
jgi:hypothetical protein